MIDLHYDFLTDIYFRKKKDSVDKIKKYYSHIYAKNNIEGGILNLYFTSLSIMEKEFGVKKEDINVLEWFKDTVTFVEQNNLLFSKDYFVYGIEGCEYLNIDDLEELYKIGLRSITPVWNEENKYGSGFQGATGLTPFGEDLIKKAIKLKIGIDLSHTNEQTFFDIIELAKEEKKKGHDPIVFASHSNVKKICDYYKNRHLTDEQIIAIKELNGIIGLMSYKKFVIENNNLYSDEELKDYYIRHISYVKKLLGGVDYIGVSTDTMNFHPDRKYHNYNIYNSETIAVDLKESLLNHNFSNYEINKIMNDNGKKIIRRLKGERS